MSLLQNKAVHGAGGFLLMGGWAVFANRQSAIPAPLIAGLVQGALTACITLGLKSVVEALFRRATGWCRILLPTIAAFLISLALLSFVHWLAGTPELLLTISVPLNVSTLYACLYTLILSRNV